MHRGYQIIAVTPAGRRRFLEILLRHTLTNITILDEHHLWNNTPDAADIEYMERVASKHSFFKLVHPTRPLTNRPAQTIYQFFPYCVEKKTIYIRFDDDICYICPKTIEKLVNFRIDNPDPFLVFPIIICNSMEWVLEPFQPVAQWPKNESNSILPHIRRHVEFLSEPCSDRYKCSPYTVPENVHISINCICWTGEDFAKFNGIVPPWPVNEETWLTQTKPTELKRPNCIMGDGVVVHFSYSHGRTMHFLEKHTDLYQRYLALAKKIRPTLI